ncbi:photosynthetic complex assembly protein PuhC [Methylopila turkensis]|uniref:Photosynthetic complex assembly protein n=1 Tax=Methylopila turkensis TaxID=1437816 RepID=A0A9W6JII7_9HYPH|nr:photosynthetic complex assembly protein PuhC [Methylopila turkensis]GLK78286.1 hypothetical protein GCM10008174_00270 [Methylopila turkensis]
MSVTADNLAPPRIALIGAGLLAAAAFGAALLGRADIGAMRNSQSPTVESRSLVILATGVGSSSVFDAETGALIRATSPGVEDGFVWGAVNGLSYGRKRVGGALDAPYMLVRRADGKLTLTDSVTGQRVLLNSFGTSNVAAFDRLLAHKEAAR